MSDGMKENPVLASVLESARRVHKGLTKGARGIVSASLGLMERLDPPGQLRPPLERLRQWAEPLGFTVETLELQPMDPKSREAGPRVVNLTVCK